MCTSLFLFSPKHTWYYNTPLPKKKPLFEEVSFKK